MDNKNQGFTLVELSIVLVIIGLIVGGIVGGQSLIHSAKLNSVVSDVNKYTVAVKAFQLQYDALPGDMVDGYAYWGVLAGCADTLSSTGGCNGDGDGYIEYAEKEDLRAWQHLSLSGILPGNYTGSENIVLGGNMPASKIEGGGYWLTSAGTGTVFGQTGRLVLQLGSTGATPTFLAYSIINAVDAKTLDKKKDDGKASTGNVIGLDGIDTADQCNDGALVPAHSGAAGSANYLLSNQTIGCRVYFYID